jgi:hypothetical protein
MPPPPPPSSSSFRSYLSKFEIPSGVGTGEEQTHTWFSPTRKTVKLHVPIDKHDEFIERVYQYISKNDDRLLEDVNRGENSITEKIQKERDRFRLFADIDF